MTTVLIFLTLLGCDDAIRACDVLAIPSQHWESRADCQQAAEALLERSLDRPYPSLVTQCGTVEETVSFLESVSPPEHRATAVRAFLSSAGQ
ncbi:hypothetical protein [Thalassobaculum sp.]|uniref:hypothetical protein n=1 Tax=Thalassobaculum sp. TaxID=2022740 RepID=UPI0032EC467F